MVPPGAAQRRICCADRKDYEAQGPTRRRSSSTRPTDKAQPRRITLRGASTSRRAAASRTNTQAAKANLDAARIRLETALRSPPPPRCRPCSTRASPTSPITLTTTARRRVADFLCRNRAGRRQGVGFSIASAYASTPPAGFPRRIARSRWFAAQNPDSEPASRAAQHEGATGFYVQVGTFTDFMNANRTVSSLKTQGLTAEVVALPTEEVVRVGPLPTFADARAMQIRLIAKYPGAEVVP